MDVSKISLSDIDFIQKGLAFYSVLNDCELKQHVFSVIKEKKDKIEKQLDIKVLDFSLKNKKLSFHYDFFNIYTLDFPWFDNEDINNRCNLYLDDQEKLLELFSFIRCQKSTKNYQMNKATDDLLSVLFQTEIQLLIEKHKLQNYETSKY